MVEAKKETEDVTVPEGSGERLRDIPNVAFKMGKMTGEPFCPCLSLLSLLCCNQFSEWEPPGATSQVSPSR